MNDKDFNLSDTLRKIIADTPIYRPQPYTFKMADDTPKMPEKHTVLSNKLAEMAVEINRLQHENTVLAIKTDTLMAEIKELKRSVMLPPEQVVVTGAKNLTGKKPKHKRAMEA
jgi:hypothetical protein